MIRRTVFPLFTAFLFLLWAVESPAQAKKKHKSVEPSPRQELIYDNHSYLPVIRTVQLYPSGAEGSFPSYILGSGDNLHLSFDDLRADVRNYYVSMEHCDRNWRPSRAGILDYAEGINEERLDDYQQSQSTLHPYTHYIFRFPSPNLRPKIAGNYILKVYEDADKERLILTRRFYVVNPLTSLSVTVKPSTTDRFRKQKLDVRLTTAVTIPDPQRDLTVMVLQNQREDQRMELQTPSFSAGNELRYTQVDAFDFNGNNEFRFFDIRNIRTAAEGVQHIETDSTTHIKLQTDQDHYKNTYVANFDRNGRFLLRSDASDQPDAVHGDYANVVFSLKTEQTINGNIFVVGGFSNFQRKAENRLSYDPQSGTWQTTLLLKQGVYDYEYIVDAPSGELRVDAFSGSHYDTGNEYQILIYNRRPGSLWDELIGFQKITTQNSN